HVVKTLRGLIPVTLLGEQKPEVIIDDIMRIHARLFLMLAGLESLTGDVLKVKGKKYSGPNVEVTIDELKEPFKGQYHIKMAVRSNSGNATHDYTWTNSVHQRIELQDARGNKYQAQGYQWENSSPSHVQATFHFGSNGTVPLGPPVRLVYNHWTLMQHTIEFEFKNLQLP